MKGVRAQQDEDEDADADEHYFLGGPLMPTCHILPPSEKDLGLFWADSTDLEGKYFFHRIG